MILSRRLTQVALLLTALILTSCRGQLSDRPPVHPNPNMDHQERFNAQQENPFFADNRSMRAPVEGTVARGQLKEDVALHTGTDAEGNFISENPYPMTREFLYRGQDRFDIFCSVCHGGTGDGAGIIMTGGYGYVPAPSFHTDMIREMPDGQIYSAIYDGVRTMPSYRTQIPLKDRWAIVAYIRALQESQSVPEDEVRQYGVDIAALQEAYQEMQEAEEAAEEATDSAIPEEVSAELGEQLFTRYGCQACHSTDGSSMIGPTLANLYNTEVDLEDGSTVTADDEYLIESIVDPSAKLVAGYPNMMQPFSFLEESEVLSLVEYIKTLADN